MFNPNDIKCLIDDHGVEVTFTVVTEGSYDPTTGTVSNTSNDYTVKVYFFNDTSRQTYGTNIEEGYRRVVFPLIDTSGDTLPKPQIGDTVSGYGDTVHITRVDDILSVTSVCYICWVSE